eukprot:CAMPEP_0173077082 /NCGR_PEP_ID=MMETSP1102-20130122/12937_1 /TAXON_ID=49646 /ORGANISM="Geminigera sp., Strain Caron Lab Isolate" /LENGTH=380 /DNA_ID=CAMNT_0013947347 /DNA_START=411 /DNA_END=1553 /DNA_ORIENTATION=+
MLSEDEEALRCVVERFSKEVLGPKVGKMDAQESLDKDVVDSLFEQGIMGIEAPIEYGGVGLNFTASCLAVEEIARVDPSVAVLVDIQNTLLITAMMRYGTQLQKDTYLTRLCTDTCASFCLSEPSSGSDAFALKTRAKRDEAGGEWIINGSKCWISNAKEAGLFLVFANAAPENGHKGITAFVVDKENPGITVGRKEEKLGIKASSTCEVIFEDCVVKDSAVLGKVGGGYKMAIDLLNEGRIGIGAQMVGLARGAFDAALAHAHERKQFGTAVADFQGMQFQYARAAGDIEAARVMVYNAARLKECGMPFVAEAAMAKLRASEVAQSVASQAIDWMGGVGFTRGLPAEKFYRDSKIGTIYEGTSNIQLLTIAKSIQAKFK